MGFSHPSSCHGRPFCAGVILEKLHIYSASDDSTESTPGVFDKHVKLHQFGIYWDWNQSHFIDTSSPETLQQGMLLPFSSPPTSSSPLPLHYLLTPLSLEVEIHVDTRRAHLRRPSLDQAIAETSKSFTLSESSSEQLPSLKPLQRCYHVVHSISPDASLEDEWSSFRMRLLAKHGEQWQTEEALQLARRFCERCHERMTTAMPVVAMEGEMSRFAVVVDRQQYGDILEFVSSLSTQILRAKYQRFRPKTSVETSPRAWWRFAIRSVVEENQSRRTNHGWKAYVKFKQMRAEYIELYRKKKDSKQAAKDPKLLARLQKLEDRLSVENVLLFRKVATNQLPEEGRRRGLFRRSSRRSLSVSRGVEESGRRSPRSEAGWLELLEVADEADESPWEGGSPRDGQLEIGFKLQRMSLSLVDGAAKVGMCKLEDGGVRFVKQREFVQCWLGVSEIQVTDRCEDGSEWKRILYAEKDALFDATRIVPFLPKELLAQDSPPFLQVALEAPAAGDMDVRIRVCSLHRGQPAVPRQYCGLRDASAGEEPLLCVREREAGADASDEAGEADREGGGGSQADRHGRGGRRCSCCDSGGRQCGRGTYAGAGSPTRRLGCAQRSIERGRTLHAHGSHCLRPLFGDGQPHGRVYDGSPARVDVTSRAAGAAPLASGRFRAVGDGGTERRALGVGVPGSSRVSSAVADSVHSLEETVHGRVNVGRRSDRHGDPTDE